MMNVSMNNMISDIGGMAKQAQGISRPDSGGSGFGDALKSAVDSVNETMKVSGDLKEKFEMGNKNVSLADVMIASQKANISFQAMLQVRNKLINAYQEIMNMQV